VGSGKKKELDLVESTIRCSRIPYSFCEASSFDGMILCLANEGDDGPRTGWKYLQGVI